MRFKYIAFAMGILLTLCIDFGKSSSQSRGRNQRAELVEHIYAAVKQANRSAVQMDLGKGADVNFVYMDGESLLMRASVNGHTKMVMLLLKRGAEVNYADRFGLTALGFAVLNQHKDIVRLLLKHKADVNGTSRKVLPLILAAETGNIPIAQDLLDAGAKIDARSSQGETALMAAIRNKHHSFIKLLQQYKFHKK